MDVGEKRLTGSRPEKKAANSGAPSGCANSSAALVRVRPLTPASRCCLPREILLVIEYEPAGFDEDDNVLRALRRQFGKGLERQRRVLWRKGGDEGGRERKDLVEAQRRVERLREWRLVEMGSDEGGMTGLDGQDAASSGEELLFEDRGRRSEVAVLR